MNQPRPNSACSRPKTGLTPAPEQKKSRKDVITDVYRILKKAKIFCIIRGVRRGLTRYKHTGANYLNAALTDTFNKLRVKSNIRTPRTTFNSGKPPSLISTKDSRPALKNPSSLARTNGYAHIPDRKIWEALSAYQSGIWSRFTAGSAAAHDMVEKARIILERNLYAKDSLVRPK